MTLKIQTWDLFGLFTLLMMLILSQAALAQTTAFSYQGKLIDAGNLANANYDLQFKLFDTITIGTGAQQGAPMIVPNVAVAAGIFTVQLDFGASVFTGAPRFLEIAVKPTSSVAFTVLGPRQPITSTPYTIKSANAATADGLSSVCAGCVTGAQIGSLPTNSSSYIQNTATLQAASNFNISGNGFIGGNLGIGTTAPATPLEVNGLLRSTRNGIATQYLQLWGGDSASIRLTAQSTLAAEKPLLIQNLSGAVTPGDSNNIQFQVGTTAAPSTKMTIDKDGKVRIGPSFYAGAKPMLEVTTSSNFPGVYGFSTNSVGVYGESSSQDGVSGNSGSGSGVFGSSTTYTGVRGISNSGDGVYGLSQITGNGVSGVSASSAGVGVYGYNQSGGYAGYFFGNVFVNGTINKAAVGFKIDHPLDPANKYLYHTGIESPDMLNLYNGNLTTDENGEATVLLPEWFEALNRDFRYQLTVIGVFAQAIVASKIKNNRFTIKTDKPQVEVSWQVTGIRQDAYANAHRMPIEEEKAEKERGYYLRPELFGQPEEKGVEWARRPEQMRQMKEQREKAAREQNNKDAAPVTRPNNR